MWSKAKEIQDYIIRLKHKYFAKETMYKYIYFAKESICKNMYLFQANISGAEYTRMFAVYQQSRSQTEAIQQLQVGKCFTESSLL